MNESKTVSRLGLAGLLALTAMVTGCPHNDYTLDLTPRGKGVERQLAFYRADGETTNGVPKYESFPSNELATITAAYPAGAVTREGERYSVRGEFSGTLPGELSGAGSWKTASTSLGDAGFYLERFRGNDDLAAQVNRRNAAADQLTDLVLGWSRGEFGHEPRYRKLRRFLDNDFRRDLKNLALYSWAAELSSSNKLEEEFVARYGQYLVERGYLKLKDTPWLAQASSSDDSWVTLLVQRILAEKLEVPPSGPMPQSLLALGHEGALEKSWTNFLSGTKEYRSRLRQWEQEKKLKKDAHQPNPSDVANDLFVAIITTGSSGEDDHILVRLSLPAQPTRTNGKWDEAQKRVVWDSRLETRESAARLPMFCYASWAGANSDFQKEHFGRVLLEGDELIEYCLWRDGLADPQASEWDKLLSGLQPGGDLTNRLAAFQFTSPASADFGKNLLKTALERKP